MNLLYFTCNKLSLCSLENFPIKGEGEGVSKAKMFKGKDKAKVEFQWGWVGGLNKRAFYGRDSDISWNKVLLQSC